MNYLSIVIPRVLARSPRLRSGVELLLVSPRWLVPLGAVAAATTVLQSCVPETRYEEAASAAEVQGEARRRALAELADAQHHVAELEAQLKTHEDGQRASDETLAQARYDSGLLAKEQDENTALIAQLRSDLQRANESLKAYAAENARLEGELAEARANVGVASSAAPGAASADPTPAISAPTSIPSPAPSSGAPSGASALTSAALLQQVRSALSALGLSDQVRIDNANGGVSLEMNADTLFVPGTARLRPEMQALLERATRWIAARPSARAELAEIDGQGASRSTLAEDRRAGLVRTLSERDLGKQIAYVPSEKPGTPRAYRLYLRHG